ncbi:MAG: hypothetical protein A2992_02945 [Elusimicrobia bacterium RIFCSPLOWO2_01_FULL_59_12]|nr:MAG: hypothetical protein A2992_02945 [Elusimicrobia bacterium RIFCSPLOWO2_01_FULL_59_12]
MRITLRLVYSTVAILTLVVGLFTTLQVRQERQRRLSDMERRAGGLAEDLFERTEPVLGSGQTTALSALLDRFVKRHRLAGAALYRIPSGVIASSSGLSDSLSDLQALLEDAARAERSRGDLLSLNKKPVYLYAMSLGPEGRRDVVAIVQNAAAIDQRLNEMWRHGFTRFMIQALAIALVTMLIIRWNITLPIANVTEWLKRVRMGKETGPPPPISKGLFGPLASEVSSLAHSLSIARAAAEEEAKLRQKGDALWTPERLKEHVRLKLDNRPLVVVSNREPYVHFRKGKRLDWLVPASGLVTGLEPILRACGGTWIAHGSGEADRQVVDDQDRIAVPPDQPQYMLRRVWLSKDDENGYYYGFSNEGLWPLCHIAHTRPLFREADWARYKGVNEKFARIVLDEIRDAREPLILVQDYHFALLPALVKARRPDARVALFWHIPWPNPESFGICPWQKEILQGMLGADLLGFHIQLHCNNFLDTVDHALESQIDWEHFAANRQGHATRVRPFPISVAFTPGGTHPAPFDKAAFLKDAGLKCEYLGVGVDRMDYTKGILERFRGVERFLEKYPAYVGRFTFVELGAPSRTLIKSYQDLVAGIEAEAQRINWRFQTADWKPIILMKKHHSHEEIEPFYKAADVCLVTSLHDGMNLVAKEYIASRGDEDGILILSRFTGASRELRDALQVNPYDSGQLADAIKLGLEMDPGERRDRMVRMRDQVRDRNVYRWGADLISELADIRIDQKESSAV